MSAIKFVPVRVNTLNREEKIGFNAYIKVAEKYHLYCNADETLAGDKIKKLKAKRLKKIWINSKDENLYRQFMLDSIALAYDSNSNSPIEKRAEIIQGVQQSAAEDIIEEPESPEHYNTAKMGAEDYVNFILKEDDALKAVLSIKNIDHSVSQHCVNVASLAIAVAQELKISDAPKLKLLTMGGLLHDFEHMYTEININKPISSFSADALLIYKRHPVHGAEKVISHRHFDKDVIDIIHQHEELINGTGFPKGLREAEINPLALVVGCANAYDRIVSFEGQKPKAALKQFLVANMGLYPLDHVQALQRVLKDRGIVA